MTEAEQMREKWNRLVWSNGMGLSTPGLVMYFVSHKITSFAEIDNYVRNTEHIKTLRLIASLEAVQNFIDSIPKKVVDPEQNIDMFN
jgi:hypothetical protein